MINDREKIISYLLSKESEDINHLAQSFHLSKEKVNNYIQDINSRFGEALILSSGGERVRLVKVNYEQTFNTFRLSTVKDFNSVTYRVSYILFKLTEAEGYIIINDLADEMNVSRSTLNNDLRKAKSISRKYSCKIFGIPNKGIKIQGSEFNIRLLLIYEIFEELDLSFILRPKVEESLVDVNLFYELDNFRRKLFFKSFAISIYRQLKGFILTEPIPLYKNFEADSNVLQYLIRSANRTMNSIEIDFISFPINTRNSSFVLDFTNQENVELLNFLVEEMLNEVKKEFVIEIDHPLFFSKVKAHLLFLINRLIFKLPNTEVFSQDLKIRFPLAYELANISLKVLSDKFELTVTDVDISYFSIYFAIVLNERNMTDARNDIDIENIAIITNYGIGFFELFSKQIKDIIGENVKMKHFNSMALAEKNLTKYNLIFTTESIPLSVDLPIVRIKSLFTSQDVIHEQINEIITRQHSSIIDDDKIDFDFVRIDPSKSYRDNMSSIINNLVKSDKVSDSLEGNFLSKDNERSMLYENGIAFPHLTDDKAKKMLLIFGTNKDSKGSDLNLLIFLVLKPLLSRDEEKVLTSIYNLIFSIIRDENLVEKAMNISDAQEFYKLVEEVVLNG